MRCVAVCLNCIDSGDSRFILRLWRGYALLAFIRKLLFRFLFIERLGGWIDGYELVLKCLYICMGMKGMDYLPV
jgi:hypothetical protein